MTRVITFELPEEPPLGSVVLVELTRPHWVGNNPQTDIRAMQRLQESSPSAWHMVGRDSTIAPPLDWSAVLAAAGGRPILVLWEPMPELLEEQP